MMQALYPTMIQDHLIERVRSISKERCQRLQKIKNRSQASEYCDNVRRKITRCFGPMPKKTPLNVRVVREDKCDGFSRQNIVFESRPDYFVTGNLYIPAGQGKVPVVLGCCGHGMDGKSSYQEFCIGLVKQGYMVLIADPISQGERWQYESDDIAGKLWQGKSCVNEHNVIGKTQRLIGEFLGTWRVWDKIRALDVLLSHPRADKTRVGVTGASGGGTLTCYVNALDSRPTMVAPSCYITTYLKNLENSLPCDAEQMIPGMLAGGMEMIDLILASAPRPAIILAQKYDFFDPRGAEEAFAQAKKIYRLLGAEENIQLSTGPQGHGYSIENREAMYKFFNKHADVKASVKESRLNIKTVSNKELFAADGNVNKQGSKPAWKFTAEKAKTLKQAQPKFSKKDRLKKLEKILKLPKRKKICDYRISRFAGLDLESKEKTCMMQYLIESEPRMFAVLNRIMAGGDHKKAFCLESPEDFVLFLSDSFVTEEYDISKNRIMGVKTKDAWVLDVRGFGSTQPQSMSGYVSDHPYGMDYMLATTYDMLGESLLGRRVHDALCTFDLLAHNGAKKIQLVAKGHAAIVATLAGALHPKVKKVELIKPTESFYEMTQKPMSPALFSNVVPNFLKYFDLTDFIV